jgi:putative membrane protein
MIVKRNFDPRKVAPYVWRELLLALVIASAVYLLYGPLGVTVVALPFGLLGLWGAALSIFLAFRNNTSFTRWGEAAQLWATIAAQSRIFARLIVTFTDAHQHTPQYQTERAETFKREMIQRHLAWVHGLRLQLRGQPGWDEVARFLSADEYEQLRQTENKTNFLLRQQGQRIYAAMANGTLQGFDSFQLEGVLGQLTTQQAACERLKRIPVPRQYDYFTRLFVRIFIVLTPFCLVSVLTEAQLTLWLIPLTVLLAFLFTVVERTGEVNEEPFENRITDVPLSAFCRTIERDLAETLGERNLPAKLEPKDGYLW